MNGQQNIVNGESLPTNYTMDNSGKVYGISKHDGATYCTGVIQNRSGQYVFNKYSSPVFVSHGNQPQMMQPNMQMMQQPNQPQMMQPPQMMQDYPKSNKSTNVRYRNRNTTETHIAIEPSEFSVIEEQRSINVKRIKEIRSYNEVISLIGNIEGSESFLLEERMTIVITKVITKQEIDMLIDDSSSIFVSTALDSFILEFINSLKGVTDIKISVPSDWSELKSVKGNENVNFVVKSLINTLKDNITNITNAEIGSSITLPIMKPCMTTDDDGIRKELLGIKSLDMVSMPENSLTYSLLENKHSSIVIKDMVFRVIDNKIGIRFINR